MTVFFVERISFEIHFIVNCDNYFTISLIRNLCYSKENIYIDFSSKITPYPMVFDVECKKIVDAAESFSDDDGVYDCTLNKVRITRIVFNFKEEC